MNNRKLINRADLIFIGTAAVLALLIYILVIGRPAPAVGLHAEITYHGRTVATLPLENDTVVSLAEHPPIRFIIEDGRIAFYSSDCPDQVCVRRGFLHLPGQSFACMPNRVVLTVIDPAQAEGGIDIFLE